MRAKARQLMCLTTDDYRKYFEADAALSRRFQPVMVDAPSPELARRMLEVYIVLFCGSIHVLSYVCMQQQRLRN
jgi:hypothetical protein